MRTLFPVLLLFLAAILLSACAGESGAAAWSEAAAASDSSPEGDVQGGPNASLQVSGHEKPADMVVFDGTVYVATTELVKKLWKSAGWQVSDQPIDTSSLEIPLDCTLYPHAGVSNQWIGGCVGNVQIPRLGARDIAVRHTAPDGNSQVIQVAPAPAYP